jgi:hypothetical protein
MLEQTVVWIPFDYSVPKKRGLYLISFDGLTWRAANWRGESFFDVCDGGDGMGAYSFEPPAYWMEVKAPKEA